MRDSILLNERGNVNNLYYRVGIEFITFALTARRYNSAPQLPHNLILNRKKLNQKQKILRSLPSRNIVLGIIFSHFLITILYYVK